VYTENVVSEVVEIEKKLGLPFIHEDNFRSEANMIKLNLTSFKRCSSQKQTGKIESFNCMNLHIKNSFTGFL